MSFTSGNQKWWTWLHFNTIEYNSNRKMKNIQFFQFKYLWNENWPCLKIGQSQPRVMIYINFVVLQTLMIHAKFQGNWPSGSVDFLRFWAWRPSWSFDLDQLYKLSFPLPKEAPHKIWLWLAKRFLRRYLKNVDGRGTTDPRLWVYYKHTLWASWRLRWAKKVFGSSDKTICMDRHFPQIF